MDHLTSRLQTIVSRHYSSLNDNSSFSQYYQSLKDYTSESLHNVIEFADEKIL